MFRNRIYLAVTIIILLSLIPISALAATRQVAYSGGTLTITYPDSYTSCTPSDTITVTGVTAGHPITIFFQYQDVTTGWIINLGSVTTETDGSWSFPYPDLSGTLNFGIGIRDDSVGRNLAGFKWTITCELPPGGEGCTPGYWKNHLEDWVVYSPANDFDTVFSTNYFTPDITLLQAVNKGGGGVNRLARHGTAALLSAAHPEVDYPYTVAEVIAMVQAGFADPLAQANELGCSIP